MRKEYLIARRNESNMPVGSFHGGYRPALLRYPTPSGGFLDSFKKAASSSLNLFGEIKKQEGAAQAQTQATTNIHEQPVNWGKVALFGAAGVIAVFLVAKR